MSAAAVLIPIEKTLDPGDGGHRERQRRMARLALRQCAALCGAPAEGWQQDARRVPLPNGRFHWSLSHHRTCAAAVIAESPVGIDVERVAARNPDLMDEVANSEEWKLASVKDWPAFFRYWTAKEATLKANGAGIGRLDDCRIIEVVDEMRMTTRFDDRDWAIEHFELGDHMAAVALQGGAVRWIVSPAERRAGAHGD